MRPGLQIFLTKLILLIFVGKGASQEPKIFTSEDFDLEGKVKSSLVLTDYGREEFAFDTLGLLTKWVTRYNDADYDITYYSYKGSQLKERRDEKYRDGKIDKQTSIAHFYVIDSVQAKRLTETIISYNQELLDQYQYLYDAAGNLERVIRSNEQGVDETTVEHTTYADEHTVTYALNGVVEKSFRTKEVVEGGDTLRIVLEKYYVDGVGDKAIEKRVNLKDQVLEEQHFVFNQVKDSFEPSVKITNQYDQRGSLVKTTTETRNSISEQEFLYQFDKEEGGNWVKKITTPDNVFVTRRITYYPVAVQGAQEE